MKIAPQSLVLGLLCFVPACTDPVAPPSDTDAETSTTGDTDSSTGDATADDGETDTSGTPTEDGTSSGSASASDDSDEDSSDSGQSDTGVVEYFRGTSETFTPEGMSMGVDMVFARREMVPEDSQALETLYLVYPDQTWERFDLVQEVDLTAQTFTSEFETDFGSLLVEGEYLAGEDWEWTQWRSTSTYLDGFSAGWTVTSEDLRADDGSHSAEKSVYDDQGALFFEIEERLELIDEGTYEMEVGELE